MASLHILYENVADSATTLAANSNAGGTLIAANMQNDRKIEVHRSAATAVIYTLTWSTAVNIGGLGLPATNLTGDAIARLQLYSDEACTVEVADSEDFDACAGPQLGLWNWTEPLNANAFAFGGASRSQFWLDDHVMAKGCKITLTDTGNPAGYIDCARIVLGPYWKADLLSNPDYGAAATPFDTSQNTRSDSGDLVADRGTLHDQLKFDLRWLSAEDRASLMRIARVAGVTRPLFVSVCAGSTDAVLEQDYSIYGPRNNAPFGFVQASAFATNFEIQGW